MHRPPPRHWTGCGSSKPGASPARIEEALTVVSVPRTVFELSRRRVVADALRFGLAMSDALVLQAVRFGFASDARELVLALRRRFEEIVPGRP